MNVWNLRAICVNKKSGRLEDFKRFCRFLGNLLKILLIDLDTERYCSPHKCTLTTEMRSHVCTSYRISVAGNVTNNHIVTSNPCHRSGKPNSDSCSSTHDSCYIIPSFGNKILNVIYIIFFLFNYSYA